MGNDPIMRNDAFERATAQHQAGKLADAAFNPGDALHTLDQGAEAVEAYRRAVETRPVFAAIGQEVAKLRG